ncbi:hypothetical protein Tco_0393699 [Tanacetum coccineum]
MNSNMNKFENGGYYGNTSKPSILPLLAPTSKFVPGHKCGGQLFSLIVLAKEEYHDEEFVDSEEELVEMANNDLLP